MSIDNDLKNAMLKFIQTHGREDAVEVTEYDENTYESGGCETCAWTEWEVDIYYKNDKGEGKTYTFDGRFSYLIRELDRLS